MTAAGNGRHTAIESEPLSWLESSQPYTVSTDPDGMITVECSGDDVDIVFTESPPVSDLRIVVQHQLTLRTAPSVETMSGCLLHLDAHPRSLGSLSGLALVVDCQDSPLRISTAVLLSDIDSFGEHEFDLAEPRGARSIRVNAGTMTLRKPIERAEILGSGKLKALGNVSDCHINMEGSFEAHSQVVTSDIILGGDLEAFGVVSLANEKLECRNATLHGGLDSDGVVSCETLEVHSHIESTGSIMARNLRCTGTLDAERLAVFGSIAIPGS